MLKKNYTLTFLAVMVLLIGFIIAGHFLQWNSTMIRIVVVAVVVGCGLTYILVQILCFKRIDALLQNGKYHECIRLAKKTMKWYRSGKNDSTLHLTIAVSYFSMGDDEQFWQESEQVIDPQRVVEKYYWRTIFGVVTNNKNTASEQYQLFLSASLNEQYTEFRNRLALLMDILNADEETQKKDLVAKAKTIFQNKRIQDYLDKFLASEKETDLGNL